MDDTQKQAQKLDDMQKRHEGVRMRVAHQIDHSIGSLLIVRRWFQCGCLIEHHVFRNGDGYTIEDHWYHQREIECHKPHRITRGILKHWSRGHDDMAFRQMMDARRRKLERRSA